MKLPIELGADWEEFVDTWCLGSAPAAPPEQALRAIDAVNKHWPRYLHQILESTVKGIFVIAPLIDIGDIFLSCESLSGFDSLLNRLRKGEQSAFAELAVASTFIKIGISPVLEPINSKRKSPDLAIDTSQGRVFLEVIRPNLSQEANQARQLAWEITQKILTIDDQTKTEILLEAPLGNALVDKLVAFVLVNPSSKTIRRFNATTFVLKENNGETEQQNDTPQIPCSHSGLVAYVGQVTLSNKGQTKAQVGIQYCTDQRAHRLLGKELGHFTKDEINIIVIDSSNAGNIHAWLPLVKNWFQPKRNTRVGAALLYDCYAGGNPYTVYRTWKLILNPYAIHPIPNELTELMRQLPHHDAPL